MPNKGGLPENQSRVGQPTTTVKNTEGEWIAWDIIREACDVPSNRRNDPSFLTVTEAAKQFKISQQAVSAKAKREGWRTLAHLEKKRLLEQQEKDWGKRGERHREHAFRIASASLKQFKPRKPKDFKELEIADRIARRAAGLENDSIVQQTLVHINEAVEGHAEAQVLEANTIALPDQEATITDATDDHNQDTVSEAPAGS